MKKRTGKRHTNLIERIKQAKLSKEIDSFFNSELIPLATNSGEKQPIIPWVNIDPQAESYFQTRKKSRMGKVDFEKGSSCSLESFGHVMGEFWSERGDSAMIQLIPSLSEISKIVYQASDEDEDISPYIYVMF